MLCPANTKTLFFGLYAPARDMGAEESTARAPDDHPMTGEPVSRIDGLVKVTGAARYAAEVAVEGAAYGALIQSTVARGRIRAVDTAEADSAPGVLLVLTHANVPPGPSGIPTSRIVSEN